MDMTENKYCKQVSDLRIPPSQGRKLRPFNSRESQTFKNSDYFPSDSDLLFLLRQIQDPVKSLKKLKIFVSYLFHIILDSILFSCSNYYMATDTDRLSCDLIG